MKKIVKITLGVACVAVVSLVISAFQPAKDNAFEINKAQMTTEQMATPLPDHYAVFKTNKGEFTVRLYGTKAPMTVRNFDYLVDKGFYTGLTFHRVIDGFMIQAGDPNGDGSGGPGYTFPDEIKKDLHFDRPGLLAMANRGPNTNGSQFFITVAPTPWLDGHYTIFGTVVKGYDVVEKISKVKTNAINNQPLDPVVINSITLEKMD